MVVTVTGGVVAGQLVTPAGTDGQEVAGEVEVTVMVEAGIVVVIVEPG